MGKILCFIYNNMADYEITLACHMLGAAEKEVITISYDKTPIKALSQLLYTPEVAVKDVITLNDVEGLIIPGGFDRECKKDFVDLIQKLHEDKKLICAICAAPEFLAKAGILDKHYYTTTLSEDYFNDNSIKDCFPRENYLEEKVVRHENVITAKGRSFVDFGVEILDYFNMFENTEEKISYAKSYKGE